MATLNTSTSNTTNISDQRHPIPVMLWAVLAVICCLLGFPASMTVLRELRQRQRSSDFFMFNLITSDTIFIVLIPFSLLNTHIWQTTVVFWTDNFMDGLSLVSRPLFMSCICAECYFAVVHPIKYMTNKKIHTIRKIISVIIWLSTISFSLLKCFAATTISLVFNATPLIIALPVITFCDISVLKTLKKTDPSGNTNIHPQKKQVFHIITNSFIMTVFAYLPPVISFTIASLIPEALKCVAEPSGFCFLLTGCFIMPILYLDSVGKFKSLKETVEKVYLNCKNVLFISTENK